MTSIADKLIHTTIRIEAVDQQGRRSSGTGFFFNLDPDPARLVPVIVTNRHVVETADQIAIRFTLSDAAGQPVIGSHETLVVTNMATGWFGHPDPSIDLAVIPLAPLNGRFAKDQRPFLLMLTPLDIADAALTASLGALEPVVMVGYPNGIWDSVNNLPIVRRGTSATPIRVDMEGKPEFMIDAACFPGSSGSPVFLYNENGYVTPDGSYMVGASRVALLGVLYAGPQHTVAGEIQVRPIPTTLAPVPVSSIPNHLGYVVKAAQILDFLPALTAAGHIGPPAPAGTP